MSNVEKLYPANAAEKADNVLEQAIGNYEEIFLVGYNKDGEFDARSTTNLQPCEILWLIDQFKHRLLNGDYTEETDTELDE